MAGCSRKHSFAAQNIARELGNALLDGPCEVHGPDMKLKAARPTKYHYAGASVACGKPEFEDDAEDVLLNPKLVVEVLSKSTERYDRGDKFESYRSIDSLTDYLLVSQKAVLVEHYHRLADGTWNYRALGRGERLALPALGCEIVDRIYLKVFATTS